MATPRVTYCRRCDQRHRKPTAKEQRFAQEYLVDLCAAHAARRAGYSAKSAAKTAQEILVRPSVQCLIAQESKAQQDRTQINADLVLSKLLQIADLDLGDVIDQHGALRAVRDLPEPVRRALGGVEFELGKDGARTGKVKVLDRIRAWELLGRHLKLFTEVHRLEGDLDVRASIAEGRRRSRKGGDDG